MMNIPTTAKQLAEYIPTDADGIRRKASNMNGQLNFDRQTDSLSLEQLRVLLPTYLNGRGQMVGEKRIRIMSLLQQLNGNGTPTNSQPKATEHHNGTPTKPQTERQIKANETIRQLQTENERLLLLLKESTNELANENERLAAIIAKQSEKPKALKWLGKDSTRVALMFVLASFEFAGTLELLKHKGIWLALPVAFAMSFALLVFTASSNRFGQWFCIAFAFALGAIYFELLPRSLADWLFAFVPPMVTAIIVNSFNRK